MGDRETDGVGTVEGRERMVQRNCLGQMGKAGGYLVVRRTKSEDKGLCCTAPGAQFTLHCL